LLKNHQLHQEQKCLIEVSDFSLVKNGCRHATKMDFILNVVAMLFVIELDDVDGIELGNGKNFEAFMDEPENKNNPMYHPPPWTAQDVESGPEAKSGPADKTDADGDAAE